jgi:tetratricopeptide (TPR) repeat protein
VPIRLLRHAHARFFAAAAVAVVVVSPRAGALADAGVAFAQLAGGGWSSGRPAECSPEGGSAANVWERAKSPDLRKYCDLIASAASKLAGTAAMAQAALVAAREADGVLTGRAAPRVLEGRALAALGKVDDALAAMQSGRALEPSALDDPLALHAWARLLARTGHSSEALAAYRSLLPRTTALSSTERAACAVESGLVAMAVGPDAIDDAVAALREALHEAQDDAASVAVYALTLALDRRGDASEARALLSDRLRGDPRVAFESARGKELLAVAPNEAPAIVAFALEATDAAGARDAWTQYLTGARVAEPGRSDAGTSPWEIHARAHLAALSAAPQGRRAR